MRHPTLTLALTIPLTLTLPLTLAITLALTLAPTLTLAITLALTLTLTLTLTRWAVTCATTGTTPIASASRKRSAARPPAGTRFRTQATSSQVAVGETVNPLHLRSPFSRRFNRDEE